MCNHPTCGPVCRRPPKEKKRYTIRKVSVKREREQRQYVKIVKDMAEESNLCEIKAPGCQIYMTGLDHIQKRSPKNFLDRDNVRRCCSACNLFKELNPIWANENGHSKSRFK